MPLLRESCLACLIRAMGQPTLDTERLVHVAGRFDEKIRIIRPDTKGRFEILKVREVPCQMSSLETGED